MPNELEQLNLRVPAEMKRGIKATAAAVGLSMEELGTEVIMFYCDQSNEDVRRRREVASGVIRQIAKPDFGGPKGGRKARVKELRLPLRQSPEEVEASIGGAAGAIQKTTPKAVVLHADQIRHARIVPMPAVSIFNSPSENLPVAA